MTCRAGLCTLLVAMTSACSGGGGSPRIDLEPLDAEAEGAVAADDGNEPGDASTSLESGSDPPPRDAGTTADRDATAAPGRDAGTTFRDAGGVRVYCNQPALGVCQFATLSSSGEASYNAQCTKQGGKDEPCATTDVVGCCVGGTGNYCYYAPDYTSSTAMEGCSIMNGTWSSTM